VISVGAAHVCGLMAWSVRTNIDYHGFVIIKEFPPSSCQWIRVNELGDALAAGCRVSVLP
jgi:hypothetical protein